MDENNKWMMLLLFLFHQTERQWREFETEIKYNNRYFPKSQILDELKEYRNMQFMKYMLMKFIIGPGCLVPLGNVLRKNWSKYVKLF